MKNQNSKIPKKSPNSSIFLSDEDDDIDQFRKLEEAVQQDSSSDPDIFLNPDRLKKKFPNLFSESNDNHEISPSSSFDEKERIFREQKQSYPDNTEQILQLTNDLHQAFRLVTQKKAELEKEQQKFIKEKKNFAKEKARYESEQIFADTEASNSASYMLLNQKYKALKKKYKFKKNEWQNEKQQYINQINILNEKLNELKSRKDFSPNRTNSIAVFDSSSDSGISNDPKTYKNNLQTNNQPQNIDINNKAIDNPFNLINISPSMKSKQSQNQTFNQNLNNNIADKNDFRKLSFDGSDNDDSDSDQFNVIEDENINYNSKKFYMPPKSDEIFDANSRNENQEFQQNSQFENFNTNTQNESQEFQQNSQFKNFNTNTQNESQEFQQNLQFKNFNANTQNENEEFQQNSQFKNINTNSPNENQEFLQNPQFKNINTNSPNENQEFQRIPQIKNFNTNTQNQNKDLQSNSKLKQLSPQIPESLKSESIESIDQIELNQPVQFEQKENKMTAFSNWDDYDDYSDPFPKNENENNIPKIEKPIVFRAVIPKSSQNSRNGSEIESSPSPEKKSKNSGESSILNSKLKAHKKETNKVKKSENTKIQKKKSKIDLPQKKVALTIENEISSSSPDNSLVVQKRFTSYPPLYNMNDPKSNQQKNSPTNIIKSNSPILPTNKEKNSNFFQNYDVNFDVNLGDIIEEKKGANKKIIKYFDGSTELIFSNGTRKVTRGNCVYVFYQNGDISQDFSDGARAYKYSNGTVDLTLPNGVILCVFPNGQRETHFLNGDKEIIYPTGETKYLKA